MFAHTLRVSDGEAATLHDLGGDGPPLLLTHGNGLNAGMWATVVPRLADRFHCWGLDFRGHGASRPIDEDSLSVDRGLLAEEILAAVEFVGGGPIAAAGHSLGAATLVRTEMEHPGTFSSLWLFEPVLVPAEMERPPGPGMLMEMSRKRRMVFDSVDDCFDRYRSKPPYADCEAAAVRAYVDLGTYPLPDGTVRLSCAGETEARIYEGNPDLDFARFAEVTCPTVVARGMNTAPGNDLPPMVAPIVVEALADARLEDFDHLTHFGPMEDGAAVAASIVAHAGAPSA